MDDPGRFETGAWFAFTEGLGFGPYPAARLAMFLLASDAPISTESVEGALLKSSSKIDRITATVRNHEDRIRRKAPEAIARADERERAWLTSSSAAIVAVVVLLAKDNARGALHALEVLRQAGWGETLDRVSARIDASMRSNFPPAEGPLSPAARRLLRKVRPKTI